MYQNTIFKTFQLEICQTSSLDFFSALYHLTYLKENDIDEILNIEKSETIEQVAIFERKANFKRKFNITKYDTKDQEFI